MTRVQKRIRNTKLHNSEKSYGFKFEYPTAIKCI